VGKVYPKNVNSIGLIIQQQKEPLCRLSSALIVCSIAESWNNATPLVGMAIKNMKGGCFEFFFINNELNLNFT
jgi:hypothetical protein